MRMSSLSWGAVLPEKGDPTREYLEEGCPGEDDNEKNDSVKDHAEK